MRRTYLGLLVALAGILVPAAELYKNDFEQKTDVRFHGLHVHRWISSLKVAEREGFLQLHRVQRSEFNEKNYEGVFAYAIDLSLQKGDAKWGPACMFRGGDFRIPVDRPLWLSGYVYPDLLPPDVSVDLGIVFTFEKDGKTVSGSLPIAPLGKSRDNFLVYCGNIQKMLKDRFQNVVLTGWMIRFHSRKPYHGQRVRVFLDNVEISDVDPRIFDAGLNREWQGYDILKNDPYVVNYTSLYREYPVQVNNVVFNSSFELGFREWYPRVSRVENEVELPDPAEIFHVIETADAPHGKHVLAITRNGKTSSVVIGGRPLKIEDGRDYVLSFYARASKPGEVLSITFASRKVSLTTEWKRYVVPLPQIACYQTWRGKKFPGRFNLCFLNTGDADLFLDAIQLEKTPLKEYGGTGILEIAVKPLKKFGLYAEEETPEFEVRYFNSDGETRKGILYWELKDHLHKVVVSGSRKITAEPQSGGVFTLVGTPKRRFIRLHLTLESAGQPKQTQVTSAATIPDLRKIENNGFFGHSTLEGDNPPNLKYTLELNRKLGMSFAIAYHLNHPRAPKSWKQHNPLWKKMEDLVKICKTYRMELIWSNYPPFPPLVKKGTDGIEVITPEVEAEVQAYAEELGRRFRGKIRFYEYFGEYLKNALPQQTANVNHIVFAAAQGLKKTNPDALLVAPGQDHMDTILTVFPVLAKSGALRWVDRLSLHTYGFGSSLQMHETMEKLKMQIQRYAPGMKAFNTEGGTCSTDVLYYDDICGENLFYPNYKTELEQAVWDIRAQVMMFSSGIFEKSAIFYSYEGNVGGRKFYHFINPDNEISPRPVFPAYARLVQRLSGAKVLGEFQQRSRNGLQGYLFRKNNHVFAALWRYTFDHIPRRVILPLPTKNLKVWDLVGNPIIPIGKKQSEIMLGDEPVWVDFLEGTEQEARRAMSKLQVVQIVPEISAEKTRLRIRICNSGDTALIGTLFLNKEKVAEVRIEAGETYHTSYPFRNPEKIHAYRVLFRTTAGDEFLSDEVRFLPVARASGPVVLDGNLGEFTKALPCRLGKAQLWYPAETPCRDKEDFSAVVRALYDEDYFYLAVEVCDDKHRTPHEDSTLLWANDALQLLFVLSGNSAALSDEIIELAVSDTNSGPRASFTFGARRGMVEIPANVIRVQKKTIYELAIPWKTLKSDFSLSGKKMPLFNLAISDNNGFLQKNREFLKGYEKSLQMSRGIVDKKNPATALRLVFEK